MKKSFFIMGLIGLFSLFAFSTQHNQAKYGSVEQTEDTLKLAALIVLENNCNECHLKKKPNYVFTQDNMEAFAASINLEVFVKGKMPKGKKNVLLAKDKATLKRWIDAYFKNKA